MSYLSVKEALTYAFISCLIFVVPGILVNVTKAVLNSNAFLSTETKTPLQYSISYNALPLSTTTGH
jgi:hypothetical protein